MLQLFVLIAISGIAELSAETAELIVKADSMCESLCNLNTRRFCITGRCIPGTGYDSCELVLREEVLSWVEDEILFTEEVPRHLTCTLNHCDFTITSEFFADESGTLTLCVSTWEENGNPLFSDRFYFSGENPVACSIDGGELHLPSDDETLMGTARLNHFTDLLEAVDSMIIPAPPAFEERFNSAYRIN